MALSSSASTPGHSSTTPAPAAVAEGSRLQNCRSASAWVLWDPHQIELIEEIGKMQGRAACFGTGSFSRRTNVTEMTRKLQWQTLQRDVQYRGTSFSEKSRKRTFHEESTSTKLQRAQREANMQLYCLRTIRHISWRTGARWSWGKARDWKPKGRMFKARSDLGFLQSAF